MQSQNTSPYAPVDQTDVVIEGLDIGAAVGEIHAQGYTVVEQFVASDVMDPIREAFDTEVPITEMRFLGSTTGNTWRAHNLLAKTRAIDELLLDPRLRALVQGVLPPPARRRCRARGLGGPAARLPSGRPGWHGCP